MANRTVNYEQIITKTPNGVVTANGDFIIRYVNASAARLMGLGEDEALDRDFFDVLPQMSPFKAEMDKNSLNHIEVNGKNLSIRSFKNEEVGEYGGIVTTYVFIMHDYDELISLTAELELTQRYIDELQEIIEASFDGILVTDGDANVLMVNQSYVRNTAIQKEELIGHNMRELINPDWMKDSVALIAIDQRKPATLHHKTQHDRNIMVTGTPIFDKAGAISKVVINSRDISEIYELRDELSKLKEMEKLYFSQDVDENLDDDSPDIVVADSKMTDIFSLAKKLADFKTTVLITGESGVGKDVLANYIHNQSRLRRDKSLIAVNCGAIPENLLESELFGYDEGAFTGAVKGGKSGLIEAANGGTLFLDEISEMPLTLQVKLLRAIESPTITPVGSGRKIPVDFRLIAATNKNLSDLIEKGVFREDLYYRLSVVTMKIPPLRERRDEISIFALRFLLLFNRRYGLDKKLTWEVIKELEDYPWEGNVRQLKNIIEYMSVVSNSEYLQVSDLPWMKHNSPHLMDGDGAEDASSFKAQVDAFERKLLLDARRKYGSSRKMAKALKIDSSTIIRKMKKLNVGEESDESVE
jgi:PAS domain S-box-containing protein